MKKIAFHTLGCKLNFAETSSISNNFEDAGFEIVGFDQVADLYVINTCTVTREAEKKCKKIIQKAHRIHPNAKIAVIGCFPALREEEVKSIDGVNYILGAENKSKLLSLVQSEWESEKQNNTVALENSIEDFTPIYSSLGRTRSFFKIQDGCDNFCSYCAIPYARGRSISASIEKTIKKAREIADKGFKEVIFTGVNIGDFGRKNGECFYDLLCKLIEIQGIERWRISSVEPDLLDNRIIKIASESNSIMPHFHIPLQSGSDSVLKQMKRHYNTELFATKVKEINSLIPHAFIAADVIVGFPTETQAEFEQTYCFINSLPLSAIHVFPYSPRPEAVAFNIESVCSKTEKEDRSRRLHELSNEKKQNFYNLFYAKNLKVLWESENVNGNMLGYSENYLRVIAPYNKKEINTITEIIAGKAYYHANKDWVIPIM